MSISSIIKKTRAYYSKDKYYMSLKYKGFPISATGSSEASVHNHIGNLMAFVDFIEAKKQDKIQHKELINST